MAKVVDDEMFRKVHHSVNMLHSLQNCHDTLVLNREDVDEKLFEEINNFEAFVKNFENAFLGTVMEDLRAVSRAAVINPDNSEKAKELIERISILLQDFNRMESDYIAKAETLKVTSNQIRVQLAAIKKDMEAKIRMQEKHRKGIDSTITWNTHAN